MKNLLLCFAMLACIASYALDKDQKKHIKFRGADDFVYIPSGTVYFYPSDSDYPPLDTTKPSVLTMKSFYISPYEVTNYDYLEYIYYLSRNNPDAVKKALPDTSVWRSKYAFNEPYVDYYFRHPAYRDYPLVGVSHAQAVAYCDWLTAIYNNWTTVYNNAPNPKFKKVKFRLPTEYEWYYAAISDIEVEEKYRRDDPKMVYNSNDHILFPWGDHYLDDENGDWRANFSPIDQASVVTVEGTLIVDGKETQNRWHIGSKGSLYDYRGVAGHLNDYADITAPVYAFGSGANPLGLYNMSGNVEEMVAEYGITKGGSWHDTGYYLRNDVHETYDSTSEVSSARGFRIVMDVLEYWP